MNAGLSEVHKDHLVPNGSVSSEGQDPGDLAEDHGRDTLSSWKRQ